jgi:hypothetical protein
MAERRLHGRRQRIAENARASERGELVYSDDLDELGRQRVVGAFERATSNWAPNRAVVQRDAAQMIAEQIGVRLDWSRTVRGGDPALLPSCIEAMLWTLERLSRQYGALNRAPQIFEADVSDVMAEHLYAFELIDGMMVPFESRELHVEVVRPVLALLAREQMSEVENAYQDALREVRQSPDDAITDAARALELTLQTIGCDGRTLGALAKSAIDKGLLSSHDRKLYDWIAADRAERGDSHGATDPGLTHSEAWRQVHIVGAEILRLVERSRG